MSFFGSIGKGIKSIGHFLGNVASNPITQGIVGLTPLGIPGAVLTGAIGNLIKPGGNLGTAAKGAATGALAGTAGKGVKSIYDYLRGGGALSGIISGGGKDAKGNLGVVGDVLGSLGGTSIPGLSGLEKYLGGGSGGTDWGNIAKTAGILGLGTAQALNAANLGKQSTEYAKGALDSVNKSYGERGGLRAAGVAGMLNPQTADLSGLLTHSGPYATGLVPKMPAKVASVRSYS